MESEPMLDSNGGGEFKPDEKRIFLSEIGQQSHRASSYESSIDIFPHDDHLLCEHHFEEMEHDSSYSNGGDDVNHHLNAISDVYKHTEAVSTTHSAVADHHHHHHQALLMDDEDYEMPKHNEIELVFQHVSHTIETAGGGGGESTRQILNDISGYASPGQVLAVMGPSGSGKTTLLNVLSGRTRPSYGHITLNNQKINKQLRRRICYVLQQDIFFPTLTLRQTLMYTARLRLPDSMKDVEKQALVEKLLDELQLRECQHTIIGDVSKRGLSGGEKKRANIACELLTNPSIMLIDEPTSGLDSCTAHSLVQILKNFAVKKKKTIVMTIHQPSSQMFYMLDRLLLLTSGQLAYFGNVNGVVPFFNSIGYMISLHYNPADFILEKVKNATCQEKIVEAAKQLPKSLKFETELKCTYGQMKSDLHQHHHHHMSKDSWKKDSLKSIELHVIEESGQVFNKIASDNDSGRSSWSEPDRSSTFSSNSFMNRDEHHFAHHSGNHHKKWPTSMLTQISVLTERNFIEAKHRMLSKLNWIQTIFLAIIAGLIWFQIARKEETLDDIRGWMFFTTTYWMLFGLFQSLVSFPAEREVINKERASGAYRLSSYYIAKMIGELPLTIALPSVFFFISYPMLGFHSIATFISMWLFLVISTICAQSVGLFIGAACQDLEVSVTLSALYSLSTMLFAGYYTSMPGWLSWMRYLSMVYYAFMNMQMVEFGGSPILCAQHASKYDYCQATTAESTPVYLNFADLEKNLDIMNKNVVPFSIWLNSLILVGFFVVFRLLGYLVLRFGRNSAS